MVYVFLYFLLARYGGYSLLIQGIILIVIILVSPRGLLGILYRFAIFNRLNGLLDKPVVGQKEKP